MLLHQPSFVMLPVNVTGPLCGYRFMSASSFVKVFPQLLLEDPCRNAWSKAPSSGLSRFDLPASRGW